MRRIPFLTMMLVLGLSVAVTGSACGKKDDQKTDKGEPGTENPDQKRPARAEMKRPARAAGMGLKTLFSGNKAQFPTPVAKLSFKMTMAQVAATNPALAKEFATLRPEGHKGVRITVAYTREPKLLRYVMVRLPESGRAFLVKAWGKPVTAQVSSAYKADVWLNEAAGLQAILRARGGGGWELTFWPFMSWEKALGADKTKFGFETKPLLGMKAEDVLKTYADYRPRKASETRIDLNLPNYAFSEMRSTVIVTLKDGAVSRYYFTFYYGALPSLKAAMETAIKAKFGTPVKAGKMYTDWSKNPPIKMGHSEPTQQFSFWVGKR